MHNRARTRTHAPMRTRTHAHARIDTSAARNGRYGRLSRGGWGDRVSASIPTRYRPIYARPCLCPCPDIPACVCVHVLSYPCLYVCMPVCVYVLTCLCVCMCVCLDICMYACPYISMTHACPSELCMYACPYIRPCACVYVLMSIHTCAYICMRVHIHVCVYVHQCISHMRYMRPPTCSTPPWYPPSWGPTFARSVRVVTLCTGLRTFLDAGAFIRSAALIQRVIYAKDVICQRTYVRISRCSGFTQPTVPQVPKILSPCSSGAPMKASETRRLTRTARALRFTQADPSGLICPVHIQQPSSHTVASFNARSRAL